MDNVFTIYNKVIYLPSCVDYSCTNGYYLYNRGYIYPYLELILTREHITFKRLFSIAAWELRLST